MRHGRYSAAWRISDAVARTGPRSELPRHLQTLWRGTPITGRRVLIRCYRGLGDTIQFIRYAPLVKSLAREVIVSAQAELIPILRTIPALDRVIALDRDRDPPSDVELEITELPHLFRTTVRTIPDRVPYLHAPQSSLPQPAGMAVGIVWAAGDWDRRRTIPPSELDSLSMIPGITLYSFQCGAAAADARKIGARPLYWRDIIQESSLLRSLDLLISVDTMPAHLAGALAMPVWLLLHSEPDWRWMVDRNDSPWYPTMRLFRQQRPGEWRPESRIEFGAYANRR